eukprot:5749464-Prymnesium_polylepis.1
MARHPLPEGRARRERAGADAPHSVADDDALLAQTVGERVRRVVRADLRLHGARDSAREATGERRGAQGTEASHAWNAGDEWNDPECRRPSGL